MSQAVIIESFGSPEVLKLVKIELNDPSPHEVRIKHSAIEVNYTDIYHRKGIYPLTNELKIPGVSAIGYITQVGSNVKGFSIGERVGYATSQAGGAYCEERNIESNLLIPLPKGMEDKLLASCLLKGLTAHMLACQVFVVRPGIAVLIHAASGGVGRLLARWCNSLGAYVIGTVGSDEKKKIAIQNGCHLAINYTTENFVAKVREITNNIGVHVVYDSVGEATLFKSLDCLMNIGMIVLYGSASGVVSMIDPKLIYSKSLFFTRPLIYNYASTEKELRFGANKFFSHILDETLKISNPIEFKLSEVVEAHKLLESRKNLSSIVLVP